MHSPTKLGSFMALRANGWSLAKISKQLDISKSTLWEWDNKHQSEIHFLKHLQLEKLQERYLPTYEEELQQTAALLVRVQQALDKRDMEQLGTEFLFQISMQLRARLNKMRDQVPLRTVPEDTPLEPLPFTGCVTRQDMAGFMQEFSEGEVMLDAEPRGADVPSASAQASSPAPAPSNGNGTHPSSHSSIHPSASTNGHVNGHSRNGDSTSSPPNIRVHQCSSVVKNSLMPNRTFPDDLGRGVKNGSLSINNLQKPFPNDRPETNP